MVIPARWNERYSGPQSPDCDETGPAQQLGFEFGPSGQDVAIGLTGLSEADPFRTYCPGPEFIDVFADAQTLADGAASRRELTAASSTLTLTGHAAFSGLGYAGSRSAHLAISLRRLKAVAGTRTETAP